MSARRPGGAIVVSRDLEFESLFHTTYRDVLAYAARRVRERAAADDIVSETFLVAWRRFAEVPVDHHEARLWLYRVAQYCLLNAERGRRRRAALSDQLLRHWPASTHGVSVVVPDEAESLVRVFLTLSAGDQHILLLSGWENLSATEIATVLACSVGAASTRLSRARAHFDRAVARENAAMPGEEDR